MAYQDPITLAQQQYKNRRDVQNYLATEKKPLAPATGSMDFVSGTATPAAAAPRRTTVGTNQVGAAPQSTAIKMATLFDPVSNRRVAVQVDSPQAKALFSQGFKLETPQAAPSPAATADQTAPAPTAEMVTETAMAKTEAAPATTEQPKDTTEDILKKYGVSKTNAQSPFTAFAESYRQVYDSLGLTSVKYQIDQLTRDYADLNERKNDESFQVNENPWLTEGQRRDRLSALDRKYEGKTQNLTSKLTLLGNLLETGRQEAQFIVQQGLTQQRAGQQFQQDLALKAIDIAERQAQEEAKMTKEAENADKRTLTVAEARDLGVPFGTTVAEARKKGLTPAGQVDTEVVTVGGRKVLINSNTGETIRVLGGSGEGGGAGGGTGAVTPGKLSPRAQQVFDNPSLLDSYTPTERGKILDEFAAKGVGFDAANLTKLAQGQRDKIAGYDDLERAATEAQNLLDVVDTGPVAGRVGSIKQIFGAASPEFTQYRSTINNMNSQLLFLRSGAAVTPQEFERIKGFIPSINEDEKTAAQKIPKFFKEIRAAKENYIKRSTQTTTQVRESAAAAGPTIKSSSGKSYNLPN